MKAIILPFKKLSFNTLFPMFYPITEDAATLIAHISLCRSLSQDQEILMLCHTPSQTNFEEQI